MGTPIERILDKFLKSIDDETLALMEDTLVEDLLLTYLEQACADFEECKQDLTVRGGRFVSTLTPKEENILAKSMIPYWLSPKVMTMDNLRLLISDSDYNQKSPANLLEQLRALKRRSEYDVKVQKNNYTFSGLDEWF